MARELTSKEQELVSEYSTAIFGHCIVCQFCGWQLTNHLHGPFGEDSSKTLKGFEFLLDECPGYVPIDQEEWQEEEKTVPAEEREKTIEFLSGRTTHDMYDD